MTALAIYDWMRAGPEEGGAGLHPTVYTYTAAMRAALSGNLIDRAMQVLGLAATGFILLVYPPPLPFLTVLPCVQAFPSACICPFPTAGLARKHWLSCPAGVPALLTAGVGRCGDQQQLRAGLPAVHHPH